MTPLFPWKGKKPIDFPFLDVKFPRSQANEFIAKKKAEFAAQALPYLEDHPRTCKWLITMVIVSPLNVFFPLINGLNGL